ncbi:MAG: DUF3168 domain-containing protein [Syntrophomonadaceae bacterium]|nr:DUF3168 domain-containing protein [Syntrophomonadaceae bacterium]
MSFETDLYSRLSNDPEVAALVDTRIYPLVAPPEPTSPFCVCSILSKTNTNSHSGFGDISQYKVQVSCYADTYQTAKDVANAVTSALKTWPGAQGAQAVFRSNEHDLYDKDNNLYHVPVEFLIIYKEI